jgi:uncharacterized protein YmfQ (DUF2313 family)
MDLMALLPGYYDVNETMIRLQSILSAETEKLDTGLSKTVSQCFVSTASSMLSRYEKIYGLEVDISKSDTFRRERIKAKIAGAGTTTKQMIIDTAISYSNGEVEVIEDNHNSRFTIKFVGTLGIPRNLTDLKLTIEEIKPAHLAVTYEYVYNTWGNVNALTWEQAGAYTWERIRTVNI